MYRFNAIHIKIPGVFFLCDKWILKFICLYFGYTCLFNLYAKYVIWNAGLVESQAVIKIAGVNISNPRYADDSTKMAESEEEVKSLDESDRGGQKNWLKTQLSKN